MDWVVIRYGERKKKKKKKEERNKKTDMRDVFLGCRVSFGSSSLRKVSE